MIRINLRQGMRAGGLPNAQETLPSMIRGHRLSESPIDAGDSATGVADPDD
jgi:hypothetical protein